MSGTAVLYADIKRASLMLNLSHPLVHSDTIQHYFSYLIIANYCSIHSMWLSGAQAYLPGSDLL